MLEVEDDVDEFGRKQTVIASAVARHETFFSCVQAACYILCFYGVDLAYVQKNVRSQQKKWQKVLTCTLQPLRFCLQSVRVEFLRLAQLTGMLEESCWDALPSDLLPQIHREENKKNNVNMGAGFNPLDSFFPYDPCLLRMLHQPVERYYRAWRGVPGLDDALEGDLELEVEVEGPITSGEMSVSGDLGDVEGTAEMGRSRESSVCSESESEYSPSIHSEVRILGPSIAISMTESLGMGLLEDRENERRRERDTKDSRAQSMVSDCSLDDAHPPHRPFNSSFHSVPSYAQFGQSHPCDPILTHSPVLRSREKWRGGRQTDGGQHH
jgi:hypothetical protein